MRSAVSGDPDATPSRPRRAARQGLIYSDRSPLAVIQRVIDPLVGALLVPVAVLTRGEAFGRDDWLLTGIAFLAAIAGFHAAGLYGWRGRGRTRSAMGGRIAAAWLSMVVFVAALRSATRVIDGVSPEALLTWALAMPIGLVLVHASVDAAMRSLRARVLSARTAVVVGLGPAGREFARRILDAPETGVRLAGFFDDRRRFSAMAGLPHLGRMASLPEFVKSRSIDHVYITIPEGADGRVARLKDSLLETRASVSFLPQVVSAVVPDLHVEAVAGVPLLTVCDTPLADWGRRLVKRASDILLAGAALLVAAPVMALIAVGVKLTSRGPVLFRQRRHGLDGREIVVYKFRTMTVAEDGTDVVQAQRNDPRVTRLGRFLRASSLDELPQFINVLQGRMSVIGPRPHALVHNDYYGPLIPRYARRHKVKPGLSGWAQVHGCRGATETVDDMRARVEHDLYYLRNWSLWLDVRIALRTVRVLFRDPNAY